MFILSLNPENVNSVLSLSTSVADSVIINNVSSFVAWLFIKPRIGESFKFVTFNSKLRMLLLLLSSSPSLTNIGIIKIPLKFNSGIIVTLSKATL